MKYFIILLIFAIFLGGCSSLPFQVPEIQIPGVANTHEQPVAAETPVPEPTSPAQPTIAPTEISQPKIDPASAVQIFLDGQKEGIPYALTSNLLSSSLSSKVKDDNGLRGLMGSPESISEFKSGSPTFSGDLQKATLEVTMYSPQPTNLRFSLLVENGEWKIDEIVLLSGSAEYPVTPEGVVLNFLTSYQESPDRMSNYLTADRRASQPPGGAAAMLQIRGTLEGMVIQSAAVNPEPPSAVIKVLIRASGVDYPRTFLLARDAGGWGIDAIDVTNGQK